MKTPLADDKIVRVIAVLTDEAFGHDHWRAAQFCAPAGAVRRHGLLLLYDTERARNDAEARLKGKETKRTTYIAKDVTA